MPRENEPSRLEELGNREQPGIVAEFYDFLHENKKWWMIPILVLMGMFGLLIAFASTGAAPFIYTLF